MDAGLARKLDGIEHAIAAMTSAISLVAGVQREHGEQLGEIIRLLDQEEGEREGPTLEEMIAALITRMDTQSEAVSVILQTVRSLSTDLPQRVAGQVVNTLNGELDPATGGTSRPANGRS